jgi:uncharacterized membrane protein
MKKFIVVFFILLCTLTIFLYLYRMISDKPLTVSEAQELRQLLRGSLS